MEEIDKKLKLAQTTLHDIGKNIYLLQQDSSNYKNLLEWVLAGDVCQSEIFLIKVFMGIETDVVYPVDYPDFLGCCLLMKSLEMGGEILYKVKALDKGWEALFENWENIFTRKTTVLEVLKAAGIEVKNGMG